MIHRAKTRKQLDPSSTRRKILRAAIRLFSAHGYAGASLGDIAQAAKVRKSLIQYHFGTKEELWTACLEDRARPLLEAIDQLLSGKSSDVGALITARYRLMKERPEVRRLLAWACMAPAPLPHFMRARREQMVQTLAAGGPERLARLLVALSATDGWFLFQKLYGSVLGESVADEAVEQAFLSILEEVAPKLG